MTDDSALDAVLHVALDNAIECEIRTSQSESYNCYECAMLAHDELRRRS